MLGLEVYSFTWGRAISNLPTWIYHFHHTCWREYAAPSITPRGGAMQNEWIIFLSPADPPSAFEAGSPHSVPVGSQVDLSDLKVKPE